jgi:hypothetical protein
VILGSVFTHMFSTDMQHYIHEIARVLKTGGHGLITFFLLKQESQSLIAEGESTLNLIYECGDGSQALSPNGLEIAVGHQEDLVLDMFEGRRLKAEIAARSVVEAPAIIKISLN